MKLPRLSSGLFFLFILSLGAPAAAQYGGPVVSVPAAAATDQQVRIAELERLVRELTGKLEQAQYGVNQLRAQMTRFAEDTEMRLQTLETATPAPVPTLPQAAPLPEPAEAGAAVAPTEDTSGQLGTVRQREGKDVGGSVEPAAAPRDALAQDAYDGAFARLRQADYAGAQNGFRAFLKAYPDHPLKENAQYWLAETYYVRGQFNESAVAFAEAYQALPEGSKAPDNLLKLALSLAALNKNTDACVTLNELQARFPKGPATVLSRAAQESQRLSCTSNSAASGDAASAQP